MPGEMAWSQPQCSLCGHSNPPVTALLSACAKCLQQQPQRTQASVRSAQHVSRQEFGLPPAPLLAGDGTCPLCINACQMAEGECGFCSLREACDGKLVHLAARPGKGILH